MSSVVMGRIAAGLAALCLIGSIATANATVTPTTGEAQKHVTSKPLPAKKSSVAPRGPEVRSGSYLVIDSSDSSVLLSKNANVAAPIASITKLMTALVIVDSQLPLDEHIKITKEDQSIDPGSSRLTLGATLTRGELLHLALMASENHAAYALGRTYPGGSKAIVKAMNAKARELGMTRSRFTDTTGLSKGNVASPTDLTKLVLAAAADPTISAYSTDVDQTVTVGRYPVEYRNTNSLVRKPDWDIVLQKTGYTQAAGRCLVMKAMIHDRPVVMVLLNSFGKYTRVADAARIRRWMEAQYASTQLARTGS